MKKKLFVGVFCMVLMLFFLLQTVKAADEVSYIDSNGEMQTTVGLTVTPITADTATLTTGWYVVNSDVVREGTTTISGNVNIILVDGFTLTVTGSSDKAGVSVLPGNSLTVYGQASGTGTLCAQGGNNGAGIGGGNNNVAAGTITINSGTVTATGGDYGSGIGGGYYGSGGTIHVAGGTVTATGGRGGKLSQGSYLYSGAGIGGGFKGSGGTITISGGVVIATSGPTDIASGAGIGGGASKDGGRITISGGTVTARSNQEGAGIGGGYFGAGGIIVITGGDITASSRYRGAGIGGGDMASGGSITILEGVINATAEYGGAGVGGGYLATGGTINIQGGDITARGGMWGAGIGSGGNYNAGNITITGGSVMSYGGDFGAGIGSGGDNTAGSFKGGTIKILGGKVTAKGIAHPTYPSDAGLDIGRGRNGVDGTLLIDDTAQVTLASNGISTSSTVLGTCILQGSAAGSLLSAYEDGTKINGTLIDMSKVELSNGTGYMVSGNVVTLNGNGNSYVLFGDTNNRNIIVSSGIIANITLFAADIMPASGCAFDMKGATVDMRLVSANNLSSSSGYAGIQVVKDSTRTASLTVAGSGSLTATGGSNGAGIGGGSNMSADHISFMGGTVTAIGTDGGAGIGGGYNGAGGTVLADGENTTVSTTGGVNGYDIGSGNGNSTGGSLAVQNRATVNMNLNGTNANANFVTCTIGGEGANRLAGTYLNSQKLIAFSDMDISPAAEADAFSTVTISVEIDGLSYENPQGYISFKANNIEIGQSYITRTEADSSEGMASIEWTAAVGTYTFTAQYIQNVTSESYFTSSNAEIATGYIVSRIEQSPLEIGDFGSVTYGDASFNLLVSGGSGTGALSYEVTNGNAVSVNSDGQVTVLEAGTATITVTKAQDSNYEEISTDVDLTVGKAAPADLVFPTSSGITYGAELSSSSLSGGSGDGSFAWENPDIVPTVHNSGYHVVFTPRDTDNYDYTDLTLDRVIGIRVDKALPVAIFPTAGEITYENSLSESVLSSGSGDGSFFWENPDVIPPVINSGYPVIFIPSDMENYLTVHQIVAVSVNKGEQAALLFSGISDDKRYGDSSFNLLVSGGSGTGALSYAVTSGEAFSVDSSGQVTVIKAGVSTVTVTKAGDSNYEETSEDVDITIGKAVPAAVVFPSCSGIIYGAELSSSSLSGGSGDGSFAWENPDIVPTVHNSGYHVVFTPRDTDNYDYTDLTLDRVIGIRVDKALPVVIFPTAGEITYENSLSASVLTGGSGTGGFVWEDPDVIPPVINSGYPVIFIPSDMENYLTVNQIVGVSVNKGEQAALLFSGIPDDIRYGGTSFNLLVSGGSCSDALSYAVTSGDAVAVDITGKVSILQPGLAIVTVTKAGDSNYFSQTGSIQISVKKADQIPLSLSGIPDIIRFGDSGFTAYVNGGSGTGGLSYVVSSGNAVSVNGVGQVSIIGEGKAIISFTKDGDDFFNEASISLEVIVQKKLVLDEPSTIIIPTSIPTPTPTSAPTPTPAPTPAPTSESSRETSILSAHVQEGLTAGSILITVNIADLPKDATALKLASGQVIIIDRTKETLQFDITRDDLNSNGELEIVALNDTGSLASLKIVVSDKIEKAQGIPSSTLPVWIWIATGLGASSLVALAVGLTIKKQRRRF